MSWEALPPRQVTGDPLRFRGYVGRNGKPERHCCTRRHSKYETEKLPASERAFRCAQRQARRLNRQDRAPL